ncbi:MAG: 50S ribosomal protein L30 [Acidiferrobacteraceae bacterium]|nr:50S ribosomal protein L30 [Acidiferrobacteraceae bacterium]
MSDSTPKKITITLTRSRYGRGETQQNCVKGLGLRKINQSVEVADTPAIRGMINKISHLVRVQEN